MKFVCKLLLGLLFFNGYSQVAIKGHILDSQSKDPIQGAAVFFDQTSIWTITDSIGHFHLQVKTEISAPLIVSYLGYERTMVGNPFGGDELTILLTKAKNELGTVTITGKAGTGRKKQKPENDTLKDKWSRYFVRFFIGTSENADKTHLLNPGELRFSYDSIRRAVSVSATVPLVIVNDYLKYRIVYTLDTASIGFHKNEKFNVLVPETFVVAGKSFFQDLLDTTKSNRRFHKRREEAYFGSVLHFMRSLKDQKTKEEDFSVLVKDSLVYREEKWGTAGKAAYFKIIPRKSFTEIVPPPQFTIIYHDRRSDVYAEQNFGIDAFGNFFPWNALKFTGYMGQAGISSLLPLDYWPDE